MVCKLYLCFLPFLTSFVDTGHGSILLKNHNTTTYIVQNKTITVNWTISVQAHSEPNFFLLKDNQYINNTDTSKYSYDKYRASSSTVNILLKIKNASMDDILMEFGLLAKSKSENTTLYLTTFGGVVECVCECVTFTDPDCGSKKHCNSHYSTGELKFKSSGSELRIYLKPVLLFAPKVLTSCSTINNHVESHSVDHNTKGTSQGNYYAIAFLILIVFLIPFSIFFVMKMRTYKKLQKEMNDLNLLGLANFEKGALEHFNPNLSVEDQADLLPYDKIYEFPVEQLQLGEQIGSGAFGVVVKGEANGVFENGKSSAVAVKMVNRNIGDVYIKALASELKIMIHLGKHVNVVNLLGACTKNITKRELLVIVEYCRFGNLKDYLLNHRRTFIDQINSETDQIDFTIGSGDVLGTNDSELPYFIPTLTSRNQEPLVSRGTSSSPQSNEQETAIDISESSESGNYKGDSHYINKPVCTRDLLLWSFQVARGMEYLSSRKVLHGNLAARNILLTDENVVKICDFGLSKNMYQKDIYKKTGDEMLPVKWMSFESITDKIFSVQSDIWSFGIVLWEIFSLARTPYPGMEFNASFCEKLLEGYRMKSPQFATQEIYEVMLHCWEIEPTMRPSFTELAQKFGSMLDEGIREHYVDMNTGYLKMNAQRFKEQNGDYLSMMGAPGFKKYSSSDSGAYSNNVALAEDDEINI